LNKYDGYSFKQYFHEPQDTLSLSDDWIKSIAEDRNGDLWILTRKGLNHYIRNRDVFKRHPRPGGKPIDLDYNAVDMIHIDRHDQIWIITAGGRLFRFDPHTGQFRSYRHIPEDPASMSHDTITVQLVERRPFFAFHETSGGVIWIGTHSGLNRYNRDQDSFTRFMPNAETGSSGSHNSILCINTDSENTLWVGTSSGLFRGDPEDGTFVPVPLGHADGKSNKKKPVLQIFEDSRKNLWLSSMPGLFRIDRRTGRIADISHDPGTPALIRESMTFPIHEENGRLWMINSGAHLFSLDPAGLTFTGILRLS